MTMSYHETKFYSILNNKCPRCHEGNFFETNNPYDLNRFARMNNTCNVCQEDLRRETGFYFGAAYVSYGLTVGFGIGLFLIMCTWLEIDIFYYLITFSVLLIALMPIFYRYSRLIWAHMFVRYRGKK
jgi:uncharacterized protein (DUF983 family)